MKYIFRAFSVVTVVALFALILFVVLTNFPGNTVTQVPVTGESTDQPQTPIPYPEPVTPTYVINTLPPNNTATPYPTSSPFPTTFPTSSAQLKGEKIVYAEFRPDEVNIWAVSIANPSQRHILSKIKREAGGGYRFSLSPDATKIAYTTFAVTANVNDPFQAELWIADIVNDTHTKIASDIDIGRYRNYPVWSPDSTAVAVMRRQTFNAHYLDSILVIDAQSGKAMNVVERKISGLKEAAEQYIYIIDWAADGKSVYYQQGLNNNVSLWNVDIASLETTKKNVISHSGIPRCYSLSPDKQSLLCNINQVGPDQQFIKSVAIIPVSGAESTLLDVQTTSDPIWVGNSSNVVIADGSNIFVYADKNVAKNMPPIAYKVQGSPFVAPIGWSLSGWIAVYKSPETRGNLTLLNSSTFQEVQVTPADGSEFIGWIP
jgi:hypothetical protein